MISIVMPTHKKMPLLYATLMSVFGQDYNDFEFIVVDSSKNEYFEQQCFTMFDENPFLSSNRHKLSKLKIIRAKENTNLPGAMKMLGFEHCTKDNDFVIFLDHDDILGERLLYYMHIAQMKYPSSEMITTKYTYFLYKNDNVYDYKVIRGIIGERCETTNRVNFGNMWFSFSNPIDVYKWSHPFISPFKPIILSKNAIKNNRYSFIKDTETGDDWVFDIITHSLEETYIPIIGYHYIKYEGDECFCTTTFDKRQPSERAKKYREAGNSYSRMLYDMGYKKRRNTLDLSDLQ